MQVRLIRLLAIALALAVPLQGMAAVAAGQCMALGHHERSIGDEGHTHGQSAQHGHAENGHDHPAHSHADDAGSKADGDEGAGNDAHCGPCTACCASASIACSAGFSSFFSQTNTTYVFSHLPPPGVQPERLYRPPLVG